MLPLPSPDKQEQRNSTVRFAKEVSDFKISWIFISAMDGVKVSMKNANDTSFAIHLVFFQECPGSISPVPSRLPDYTSV